MIDRTKVERLKKWDVQDYLQTPEDSAAYLEAAFKEGDPQMITVALGNVARSRGMTEVARKAGLTRETLGNGDDPTLSTVMGVIKALGLRLSCTVIK